MVINNLKSNQRKRIAVFIAILFHGTGLAGMLCIDRSMFASLTPMNMLVMFGLIWWTAPQRNAAFFLFAFICYAVGFVAEVIGTHTGYLFGSYSYGPTLGYRLNQVPLLIGINWFIIMYCCGTAMYLLQQKIRSRLLPEDKHSFTWWGRASVVIDGALLAVFFDWVMEPVAVALNFWQWHGSTIPMLNYISWFAVSVLLLIAFSLLRFNKTNAFAVHLLMIQLLFFLILRTLLPL
ncbi:MAG: carotenoid biosynthesis protein [Agriterribacter sp.]